MNLSKLKLFFLIFAGLIALVAIALYVNNNLYRTRAYTIPVNARIVLADETLSQDVTIEGLHVQPGATLTLDPNQSVTITSTKNIIVEGKLVSKPANPAILHKIVFTNINESEFVGGGMDPLDTDVGLWIMGDGQLDIQGSQKTGWTNAQGGIIQGATSVTLREVPIGWQVGDEISFAPTESPSTGNPSWGGFDEATITAINGADIQFNTPTTRAHPMVNGKWTAEVMNLTRNVRIEGTGNGQAGLTSNGRAHIFIRSNKPQTVNYLGIRYMGPRAVDGSYTRFVTGRYGLHFHESGDGSRGSTATGTVIRDTGSHAFVAHSSNGVTYTDTVTYNTFEDAYWWDTSPDTRTRGPETNDNVIDKAIAAKVRTDPGFRGYRLAGFNLLQGLRNTIRNSVAVGVQGNSNAAGFLWPESSGSSPDARIWNFSLNNISHNNKKNGIFTWQNTAENHTIQDFVGYHNAQAGIEHGAYTNRYTYRDSTLYGNGVGFLLHSVSSGTNNNTVPLPFVMENMEIDNAGQGDYGLLVTKHTLDNPTLSRIQNNIFKGYNKAGIGFTWDSTTSNTPPERFELINNTFSGNEFDVNPNIRADSIIKVQNGTIAYELKRSDSATGTLVPAWNATRLDIAPFASALPDRDRPWIQILTPTGGSKVNGIVPVTSFILDNVGITRTEFYVNDVLVQTKTSVPYTFNWDTTGLTGGQKLQLRAYDAVGNIGVSAMQTVFFESNVPSLTPTPTPISTPNPSPTPTNAPLPTIPPIPTPTPTVTMVPGSTTLSLILLLHGIGRGGDSANPGSLGNTNPRRIQRNIAVEVFNNSNTLILSKIGTVNFDPSTGSFKGSVDLGSTVTTGIYTVKIKSNQFLKKLVPGLQTIIQGQINTLPSTAMITGDMNNDNKLDILDFSILLDCYSDFTPARNCSDPVKKLNADITDDSAVDQFDYNLFLRELTNIVGE